MARPKKNTTEAPEAVEAPKAPEAPKSGNGAGEEQNAIEKRVKALETIVANLAKRVTELERVTAYRKPVTSADILGL